MASDDHLAPMTKGFEREAIGESVTSSDQATVKVWLLEPGKETISVIRVPVQDSHTFKFYYKLLGCKGIEPYSFTAPDTGKGYGMYFDEWGSLNGSRPNECATKLLRTVMRQVICGKVVVFCETCDGAGPSANMDVTPKHFVEQFKKFLTFGRA